MPATINSNLDKIKSLILQFNDEEKLELAKYIDSLTLKKRFEKFFASFKEIPLSFDEITSEVEAVREEQFKYRSKDIK